jgi:gamma-glutamyltranspeptidase / glutathione hydrolase
MKYLVAGILFINLSIINAGVAKPDGYAIASANPMATKIGMSILRQGGNAFDAAVAVSAVLAVVEPYHSGLGGGGFWLLHDAKQNKSVFIDGREVAPLKAARDMYLDKDKKVMGQKSLNGPLSSAIPGEPAALAYMAEHYGVLGLEKDLAPAIELAEKGFIVDNHFYFFVKMGDRLEQLRRYKDSAQIFLKDNNPPPIGSLLVQKNLANTLKTLAKKGHDGFYKGKIAKELVNSVQKAGGIWTMEDLANYRLKIRKPLVGHYENIVITSAPAPSAGGISLITMLNILKYYRLYELTILQKIHYIVESMRLAFWDRANYLGDPDFVKIPVKKLLSVQHAKFLRTFIQPDKATASKVLTEHKDRLIERSPNTTHFSIIDKDGNRVAATITVNFIFGSSFVAGNTGVLLNDEMDDFSTKPGVKNVFGLVGHKANDIEPAKRPLSSMAPTFIETPTRLAVLGTPGGSRIPTMILLSSLEFTDFQSVFTMVSAPRFHHQYLPDALLFEPGAFPPRLQDSLKDMGYRLVELNRPYGDMQAVVWNKLNNQLTAASDPRNIGLAEVFEYHPKTNYGINY